MSRQTARARVALGRFEAEAEVTVTPAGLVAIGALVSGILLAVVPIVRAARKPRPPLAGAPLPPRLPAPDQS
jgi:hypothetical protein